LLESQLPDFQELAVRLAGYAARLFAEFGIGGRAATVAGVGASLEDFVGNVLSEYLEGKLAHEAARGDLFSLLATALRNDIIDALRKAAHVHEKARASLPRERRSDGPPSLDELPGRSDEIAALLDEDRYRKRVQAAFRDEPQLGEVVRVILDLDLLKPREIAATLGISTEEYHNRKKRLRRRLVEYSLVTGGGKSEPSE